MELLPGRDCGNSVRPKVRQGSRKEGGVRSCCAMRGQGCRSTVFRNPDGRRRRRSERASLYRNVGKQTEDYCCCMRMMQADMGVMLRA